MHIVVQNKELQHGNSKLFPSTPRFLMGTSSSSRIRGSLKPPLAPQGDVPQCTFQVNFDLEKKILAEANQKESQIWSRLPLENIPSRGSDQASKDEHA
ncbi:hypothetical protein H5410_046921 [Solanum commersonii]|uniref:Uncharacterized protein n=1 Tax=Solanum commersonii TaxID=4109 RepID=A0A9J5XFR5_SOLCO|nr:hypothetical protein H5410_046921 [Solanum commersonii]